MHDSLVHRMVFLYWNKYEFFTFFRAFLMSSSFQLYNRLFHIVGRVMSTCRKSLSLFGVGMYILCGWLVRVLESFSNDCRDAGAVS